LSERATRLARQALAALPPAHGYVGVDLVLGAASDGAGDAVIEVNPRLTTSYVGLRAAVRQNLARAMLQAVTGGDLDITKADGVEFSADGAVWGQRT
jgi:predicted ATP-grasp superfamily ATP-dependent carboligase